MKVTIDAVDLYVITAIVLYSLGHWAGGTAALTIAIFAILKEW